jgi:predicted protein tyrosine phosphatase
MFKKVLAVCSAGLIRSPTIAWVLSQKPYNHNCRAAGLESSYALIKVDNVLLQWADEIVCADTEHYDEIQYKLKEIDKHMTLINLELPDQYGYRDPKLVKLIKQRYNDILQSRK